MEMKRIKAPDIRTALRIAREQLGPDAMIMSNRRVADGVEIVASIDVAQAISQAPQIDATPVASKPADELEAVLAKRKPANASARLSAPTAPDLQFPTADALAKIAGTSLSGETNTDQLTEVKSQLSEMKRLLETRLEQGKSGSRTLVEGIAETVWQTLGESGLPEELVQRMLARIHPRDNLEEAWQRVRSGLLDELPEAGDLVANGGMFAFVGPTGAGKSTTLCKLAVRWALTNDADSLAIISLDTHRVGGADMPKSIARLLGCDFHAAREGESLAEVLVKARGKRLVLIDTAGLTNAANLEALRWVSELGTERKRMSTLLVLPATSNARFLSAASEKYQDAMPVACVITKVDESPCLGEALGVACRERLPIAYSTNGPDIPDDLEVANSAKLIEAAIGSTSTGADCSEADADRDGQERAAQLRALFKQPAKNGVRIA